jgi:hypothetical protein
MKSFTINTRQELSEVTKESVSAQIATLSAKAKHGEMVTETDLKKSQGKK